MVLPDDAVAALKALEETLLRPETRRSREAMQALLAEDFIEIGSSGRVYDKAAILDLAVHAFTGRMTLLAFSASALAPTIALTRYDTRLQRAGGNESHSRRSSVWRRSGNGWLIVFHQGTPFTPAGRGS